ncbi:MAG: putative transporter [Microvirga sp.]|nr:putative transporter [Microvirga sp.]
MWKTRSVRQAPLVYLVAAVVAVFCAFSSTTNAQTTPSPPDITRILERGKLIVAMTNFDVPPFFMTDANGRFYGLDVSLSEGIAHALGVPVEYNRKGQNFNEVVDIVVRGDADLAISKLSLTMARAMRVRFSDPYLVLRHGLLINRLDLARLAKGKKVDDVIRGFEGSVGVLAKSSFADYAPDVFPNAKTILFNAWEPDLVSAVSQGSVSIAYRDELEIKKVIRGNPTAALNLQTVIINDTRDDIAIAVPWNSEQLRTIINLYLARLKPLTVDGLLDRYNEIFPAKQ